ncbi:MAG: hypothetical protein ACFFDN_48525 [Candidatus Hodarchaeota archaeon]
MNKKNYFNFRCKDCVNEDTIYSECKQCATTFCMLHNNLKYCRNCGNEVCLNCATDYCKEYDEILKCKYCEDSPF